MIYELHRNEFFRCQEITGSNGQLEVDAIVYGTNPGRIFTGNKYRPSSALIWPDNMDGFCFIGDADNDAFTNGIGPYIENRIVPELINIGEKWFECFGNHPEWENSIERIFSGKNFTKWNQNIYRFEDDLNHPNEIDIPLGYNILKITKDLNDLNLKNKKYLIERILESWPSYDSFEFHGLGYCIVHDNMIVSLCFSEFVYNNTHAVHIETIKEYRNKGLGTTIAKIFLKECKKNGYKMYWDCMESNGPSNRIAVNIGLTKVSEYMGYEFPLSEKAV